MLFFSAESSTSILKTEPLSSEKNTKKTSENSHTVSTERVQTAAGAQTKNENSKSLTTSIVVPIVITTFIAVVILIVWFAKRRRYIFRNFFIYCYKQNYFDRFADE